MNEIDVAFSVIIPVCNKWHLTEQCLRSLRACTSEYPFEVLVVDNGSSDETVTELDSLGKALFGGHFLALRLPVNKNFGPACNLGAAQARAPLLFFLNNDTILTEGWAPPLVEALQRERHLAGTGPLLLYANKTVQHVGVVFTTLHPIHLYRHFPSQHKAVGKERFVQTLTAAALMLPATLFAQAGGFWEEYRNGFEDVDLCLRLASKGLKFKCLPQSVIYHLESQTPGRGRANDDNARILQRRCGKLFQPDLHIHGLRDGFEPFVAGDLDIALRMSESEEQALLAEVEGKPLDVWQQLIVENPLWFRGRKHLAQLAEEQGNIRLAVLLYQNIAFVTKDRRWYAKILSLQGRAGAAEAWIFEDAAKALRHLEQQEQGQTLIRRKLRAAQAWRDRLLQRLYEEKYAAMQAEVIAPVA
ncbi:MAG: glycosyltransferase family 2 protein [Desulfovibrio sp.]|nr:glycosyltransferase family 2 protein [Desulfovibrio sp.]